MACLVSELQYYGVHLPRILARKIYWYNTFFIILKIILFIFIELNLSLKVRESYLFSIRRLSCFNEYEVNHQFYFWKLFLFWLKYTFSSWSSIVFALVIFFFFLVPAKFRLFFFGLYRHLSYKKTYVANGSPSGSATRD